MNTIKKRKEREKKKKNAAIGCRNPDVTGGTPPHSGKVYSSTSTVI